MLPDNWNDDDNNYALRYTHNKELFILLGLRTEGSLIITLLDVNTRKVSNIGLDPQDLVKTTTGNITKIIPTASQLVDRYRKELLEPVSFTNVKYIVDKIALKVGHFRFLLAPAKLLQLKHLARQHRQIKVLIVYVLVNPDCHLLGNYFFYS